MLLTLCQDKAVSHWRVGHSVFNPANAGKVSKVPQDSALPPRQGRARSVPQRPFFDPGGVTFILQRKKGSEKFLDSHKSCHKELVGWSRNQDQLTHAVCSALLRTPLGSSASSWVSFWFFSEAPSGGPREPASAKGIYKSQGPAGQQPESISRLLVVCLDPVEERLWCLQELPEHFHTEMKSCKRPGPLNCG